jgi:hypothetical protein
MLMVLEGRIVGKLMELQALRRQTLLVAGTLVRSGTLSKVKPSRSRVRLGQELTKASLQSPRSEVIPELSLAAENELERQHQILIKRQLKGELTQKTTLKQRRSPPNFMSSRHSRNFSDCMPKFSKELTHLNNKTHRFMRQSQKEQSSNDLYLDLWRRRASLKQLNARSSALVTPVNELRTLVIVTERSPTMSKTAKSGSMTPSIGRRLSVGKLTKKADEFMR